MLLSWQTDDDGSLNGLVVHMWNIIIHSETTSITPCLFDASCYICYISNKIVGESKSPIVQKHTFFAPERYTAEILYTDSLNSA